MAQLGKTYDLLDILDESVERGYQGLNIGIPFTVSKLNRPIGGIAKSMYYLILGASRTGKSAFLYDQFVFNLVDKIVAGELKEEDVEIVLYSLEIDRNIIVTKAAIRYLFLHKNVLTTTKKLLGVHGKTPDALYGMMKDEGLRNYLKVLNRVLTVFTRATAVSMHKYITKRCIDQSLSYGQDAEGNKLYMFKNPNKLFIVAVDHIALVQEGSGDNLKKTIDLVSKRVFVDLKRQFGITPVAVQQINPQKAGDGQRKPIYGHADARDSKNTFQDCDVCLSIGSPYHEDFASINYKGQVYHIVPSEINNFQGLGDRFRLFGVEKDRYGTSNLRLASAFVGEVGLFTGIPDPNDVIYSKYNFEKWQKL